MAIFVFSQNVKLDSLKKYADLKEDKNVIILLIFCLRMKENSWNRCS